MNAVRDRRRERITALAILAAAVAIAVWVGHRPKLDPLPTPRVPDPTPSELSEVMAPVEVVELPPSMTASPPTVAPAPPRPVPPLPQQPAVMPPPPAPQPEPERVEAPPPEPTLPPTPEKIVAPLRPEPTRIVEAAPVTPLKPEAAPSKPALAPPIRLTPEPEAKAEVSLPPLKPDEAELKAFRTAREESRAREPLKPEPLPKPSQPAPEIKPLAPEPPKPQIAKAEPPPAPKPRVQAPPPSPPPQPRPAPQPTITSGNVGEGRALLRILEKGSGPGIQIGWLGDANARDRLYRALVQCFGMRVGVMDAENRLYMAEGRPGEPSEFNTDRYSGFVRRPEGAMAADEQREVTRLRSYHHVAATASIRVFPRRVDAFLISGLRQAVGESYLGLKSIHAVYRASGQHITVDSIVADGKPVPGVIDLAAVSTSCSG